MPGCNGAGWGRERRFGGRDGRSSCGRRAVAGRGARLRQEPDGQGRAGTGIRLERLKPVAMRWMRAGWGPVDAGLEERGLGVQRDEVGSEEAGASLDGIGGRRPVLEERY